MLLSPHLLKRHLLKTVASSEKLKDVVPISFRALYTQQWQMVSTPCVSPHIWSYTPAQTSNMRHQGNRPGISQTTNLMPISACDKVQPRNSGSSKVVTIPTNQQFLLLHVCCNPFQPPSHVLSSGPQRRLAASPGRTTSSASTKQLGDPSTNTSDISASKLQ